MVFKVDRRSRELFPQYLDHQNMLTTGNILLQGFYL